MIPPRTACLVAAIVTLGGLSAGAQSALSTQVPHQAFKIVGKESISFAARSVALAGDVECHGFANRIVGAVVNDGLTSARVADVRRGVPGALSGGIFTVARPARRQAKIAAAGDSWDVVVLGRIDACFVCQHGPSPQVRYSQVLAGQIPGSGASGELALVAIADELLPPDGTPIYRSAQEEICFLERVVAPGYEHAEGYRVVGVLEATPENLARFSRK